MTAKRRIILPFRAKSTTIVPAHQKYQQREET